MGEVFRAVNSVTGDIVAIKRLREDRANEPRLIELFRHEADAMRQIAHPNIVSLVEVLEEDGELSIVMQHIDGEPLSRVIARRIALAPPAIVAVADQFLAALQALHDAGFTHGDVKPANLIVTPHPEGDRVTLLDLGLAYQFRSSREVPPPASGTPTYMAPEVIRGEAPTPRSDLYAAGVVVFELLAGSPPFTGAVNDVLMRHLYEAPLPPSRARGTRWTSLDDVVLTALAKDPAARFDSTAEFARVLGSAITADHHATPRTTSTDDLETLRCLPQLAKTLRSPKETHVALQR